LAFITYSYLRNPSGLGVFFLTQKVMFFQKQDKFFSKENMEFLKKDVKNNDNWFIVVWYSLLLR
jgi:hypothetical protein